MATLVSRSPRPALDASRRPTLHRGYSCPSPRPPPVQYIAPSKQKKPAYLDDGNWGGPQDFTAFGDNYSSPYSQSQGYGMDMDMNTVASALGACNAPWPVDAGSFDQYLAAGWNDLSISSASAVAPIPGVEAIMWSEDVAASEFPSSYGTPNPSSPCSIPANASQSLSYAVAAISTTSLMAASAAAVFSGQSILAENARLNTASSQVNHNQNTSQFPQLQETPPYTALQAADIAVDRRSDSLPHRPPPLPNANSLRKRKPKPARKDRSWNVQSREVKYSAGKAMGSMEVWVPDVKVKKTRTKEERDRTALNRAYGACPQHQQAHKACDPSWLPYLRCLTSKLPMFCSPIDDIKLFRARPAVGHPLESKRTELFDLLDVHGTVYGGASITITQDLGHELMVYLTEYAPCSEDKLNHAWYDAGEKREIEMLPYCLTFLEYVRANVYQYISAAADQYLEDVIRQSKVVTQAMLLQAVQFSRSSKSTTVRDALNLLAINRMIERDWHITGPHTLGIPPVSDKACPWFGKVPVTPMMDTVLDQIVIQDVLTPLRRNVLSELQEKMQGKRKQDCFEIILTVFVMATNTEWLLRHSKRNALRYNAQSRYNSLALAQEYFHGHNILLSHFHYITRGSTASSGVRTNNVVVPSGSSLLPDQSTFLQYIQSLLASQEPYTCYLLAENRYETELYWSHQIFLQNWEPTKLEIVNDSSA